MVINAASHHVAVPGVIVALLWNFELLTLWWQQQQAPGRSSCEQYRAYAYIGLRRRKGRREEEDMNEQSLYHAVIWALVLLPYKFIIHMYYAKDQIP